MKRQFFIEAIKREGKEPEWHLWGYAPPKESDLGLKIYFEAETDDARDEYSTIRAKPSSDPKDVTMALLEENGLKGETKKRDEIIKKAKDVMRGWAFLGYNGSPFPDKPRRELESRYQNQHWKDFIEVFGEKP